MTDNISIKIKKSKKKPGSKKNRLRKFVNMKKKIKNKSIKSILTSNKKNKLKIISGGNTGSGAVVFTYPIKFKNKINYKNKSGYAIFKVTPVNKYVKKTNLAAYSEIKLHKFITKLYYNKITPHIMLYFDSKKNNINSFPNHMKYILNKINNTHREKNYITTIQETWGGDLKNIESFHKWVYNNRNKKNKEREFKYILFQILYTLECFNRINFKHNDLHLGNILLLKFKKNPQKKRHYCVYDYIKKTEIYFELPFFCEWDVRIIDFDRAWKGYSKGVLKKYNKKIDNPSLTILNYDRSFGQSRTVNKKFDTYKFLFSLYKKLENTHKTKEWIRKVINVNLINKGYIKSVKVIDNSNYGHLVHPSKGYNFIPSDKYMSSTLDMLKSDYFKEFRLKTSKRINKTNHYYSMKNLYK